MKKEYVLPMDKATKILTFFAIFLAVFVFAFVFFSIRNFLISVGILTFLFAIYFLCFLFTPLKVIVDEKGIKIKKRVGSVFIPFSEVKNASVTEFQGIRIFGLSGLFGFFGLFYIKSHGKVWVYSRSRKKLVLLETRNRKIGIGISESEAEEFLKNVKENLKE